MRRLKRDARGRWARIGMVLACGVAPVVARPDLGPGYLVSTNVPTASLRFVAPPLPPIAPLPPLPPTYVPTPKYSAEFMAELRATSGLQRSNLVVQASTEPANATPPVAPYPGFVTPAIVTVPIGPLQLMSHFLSGTPTTNGASAQPLQFHLPIPMEPAATPPAGKSRSTYESR